MNSSTEYVSIESRRGHELLIVIFWKFTNFHTVSYIIWSPLWTKCTSAAAILSNISADEKRKIEQPQAFKTRLGMCDIMSNYILAQSLVFVLK